MQIIIVPISQFRRLKWNEACQAFSAVPAAFNESLEKAEKEEAGTRAHKQSNCLLFFSEIFPGTLQVLHIF